MRIKKNTIFKLNNQEVFSNAHKVFEQMVTDGLKIEPYTTIPHEMIVV